MRSDGVDSESAHEATSTATGVVAWACSAPDNYCGEDGREKNCTFSIWINATLRYMYALLLQISDSEKNSPIGMIARRYIRPVILTRCRPSSRSVVRASSCVAAVAKTRCHVVRNIAASRQRRRWENREGLLTEC